MLLQNQDLRPLVPGEPVSALAQAIASRPRKLHTFEVTGFFGLGNREIGRVAMRVAVKREDDEAILTAHRYAAEESKKAGDGADAARTDADLLNDAKLIAALYQVSSDPVEKKADAPDAIPHIYHAFVSPAWMRANLTTDQIAALFNLYQEVKRREAPVQYDTNEEEIERMAILCGGASFTDLPEELLAGYRRTFLTHGFPVLGRLLLAEREKVGRLEDEIAELREELAAARAPSVEEAAEEPTPEPP